MTSNSTATESTNLIKVNILIIQISVLVEAPNGKICVGK